jgi:hypothetical protein
MIFEVQHQKIPGSFEPGIDVMIERCLCRILICACIGVSLA